MQRKLHIILLLLLLPVCILGQPPIYKLDHYTVDQGLPGNSVVDIVQDQKGLLWVATRNGLAFFDGYDFRPAPNFIAAKYSNINSLCYDTTGKLWIGSAIKGISSLDLKTGELVEYTKSARNKLISNQVRTVFCDWQNRVWVGTQYGLCQYNPKKKEFAHYLNSDPRQNSDQAIRSLAQISADTMLVVTMQGSAYLFTPSLNRWVDVLSLVNWDNAQSPTIRDIVVGRKGVFWVATSRGLYKYDHNKGEMAGHYLKDADLYRIIDDFYGNKWLIDYSRGLINFDPRTEKSVLYTPTLSDPSALVNSLVKTVFIDDAGVLWIGYRYGGLSKADLSAKPFKHLKPSDNGLRGRVVQGIVSDKNNKIWIGTNSGVLNGYDPQTESFEYIDESGKNGLKTNRIVSLSVDSLNNLWILGSSAGLYKLNLSSRVVSQPALSGTKTSWWYSCLYTDRGGNVWVGTLGKGLNMAVATKIGNEKFSDELFNNYQRNPSDSNSISGNSISTIYQDSYGAYWVGTSHSGIDVFHPEKGKIKNYRSRAGEEKGLSHNSIRAVFEDSRKQIWIGTAGGGLNKFDPKTEKFKVYTTLDGLPDNYVHAILEDKRGYLWISTENGLTKFNPGFETFRNFHEDDGLQSNVFMPGAAVMAANGMFYFGGSNGITAFDPLQIHDNHYVAEVVVTGLRIFNKEVFPNDSVEGEVVLHENISYTDHLEFGPQHEQITFEFASLHFASPEQIRYAYQLEGYTKGWVFTNARNRNATFIKLPAGHYTFQVKATNCDGVWSQNIARLDIEVRPYFWQTLWFKLTVLSLVLGMVAYIFYSRMNQVKLQKTRLERLVKKRTKEVEDQNTYIKEKNEELIRQQEELAQQRDSLIQLNGQINKQKESIEESNKDAKASLAYAARIQEAMLPSPDLLETLGLENFIFFRPKDIVSGDFYWFAFNTELDWDTDEKRRVLHIAAADCTGHGVPGALMSMLGVSFLNEIVGRRKIFKPSQILEELRKQIKFSLKQRGYDEDETKDGIDMSLCKIDIDSRKLEFAGAYNPMYVARNKELIQVKADRNPIGIYLKERPFTNQEMQMLEGDVIYLFSDGLSDQIGGEAGRKYYIGRFRELLMSICGLSLEEQHHTVDQTFTEWKAGYEQIDDILVIGLKL